MSKTAAAEKEEEEESPEETTAMMAKRILEENRNHAAKNDPAVRRRIDEIKKKEIIKEIVADAKRTIKAEDDLEKELAKALAEKEWPRMMNSVANTNKVSSRKTWTNYAAWRDINLFIG